MYTFIQTDRPYSVICWMISKNAHIIHIILVCLSVSILFFIYKEDHLLFYLTSKDKLTH